VTEARLLEVRSLLKEKRFLEERVAELNSELYNLHSPSLEPSYGGNGEDAITALIESRDKLKKEYMDKLMQSYEAELEVEAAITPLIPEERMTIRLYYINGYSWEDVAMAMRYSVQNIYKIRAESLRKLQSVELNRV